MLGLLLLPFKVKISKIPNDLDTEQEPKISANYEIYSMLHQQLSERPLK